jgi:hypothetical protein
MIRLIVSIAAILQEANALLREQDAADLLSLSVRTLQS